MPLKITDLQPGDRVILNCPKARVSRQREAQFEGLFRSVAEAMTKIGDGALIMGPETAKFLEEGGLWAAFLLQTRTDPVVRLRHVDGSHDDIPNLGGEIALRAAFVVEPDGSLREEEGRRVFIERRLGRVGVG